MLLKPINMAEVVLKGIYKIYDKTNEVVSDFNLKVNDSEFVVLVGPSGCGKSTTLRMIAGLEEITKGTLLIDGVEVNDVHPKDRDIAMVFQNYALYPHMTVFDNMAFALKLRKMPKEEIEKKVNNAAEILGITSYLNRKPKQLSGGQRQRVAIGRAIVREPKVFLMDEPLSNLDAKLRNQMRAELIKLHKNINENATKKTTFIYVTHDQTEAMTLGDKIVVMKDGLIMQTGTPHEVFSKPVNMFVAGFIGTPQMNFFKGKLDVCKDKYVVYTLGETFELPSEKQKILTLNKQMPCDITVGVRPENMIMCEEDDPKKITATIDVSELMGSEIYLHVMIKDEFATLKIHSPKDLDRLTLDMKSTHKIDFTLLEDKIHIFNSETEESLTKIIGTV